LARRQNPQSARFRFSRQAGAFFDFRVVLLDELLAAEHVTSRNPAVLAMSGAMRMGQHERAVLA
jgi:hypothetical protein